MAEQLVDIPSPQGRLAAALNVPDPGPRWSAPRGRAVLMPPAGLRDRCGPGRLYTRLARALEREGHTILRYDGAGLGESDGALPWKHKLAAYAAFQSGARAEEALAAARFLYEQARQPVVIMGLCGAVYDGAHLSRRAPELVAGLFGVGTPVLRMMTSAPQPAALDRAASHPDARCAVSPRPVGERPPGLAPGEASRAWLQRSAVRYLRRAADPAAWLRFVRGETDYAYLARSLCALAPRLPARGVPWFDGPRPRRDASGTRDDGLLASASLRALAHSDPRVDRDTWAALIELRAQGRRVHLVWGELDPSLHAFNELLRDRVPGIDEIFPRDVIPAAAHECVSGHAFRVLAALASAFLRELGGGRSAPSVTED